MAAAIGPGLGDFAHLRSPGLDEIVTPIEESGLLERLGGFLIAGKEAAREKLHLAGQTLKQNADLILWSAMYVSLVGEVAAVTFDLVYHPERFGEIARGIFIDLPIPLGRAYAAIGVTAAAFLPVWAMGAHGLISRRYE